MDHNRCYAHSEKALNQAMCPQNQIFPELNVDQVSYNVPFPDEEGEFFIIENPETFLCSSIPNG
jgi:hypothetical protein